MQMLERSLMATRPRHFEYRAGLMAILGISAGHLAYAAPFCIRNQVLTPQCMYYDAYQCEQEAKRQGAECSPNASELRLKPGVGPYCVVTSARTSNCAFADRDACVREAERQNGACSRVDKGQAGAMHVPDPYSSVNGQ